MTESYKVGDNVLVSGVEGVNATADTPGVIVGFMVRYPDAIDPNTVLASAEEISRCPKVYDISEVIPEGTTIEELVHVELDALIKDTVQKVVLDKRYENQIQELRTKEINLMSRMKKLEKELLNRGLRLEDIR